ncbi:restriction endonuclease subunit S [Cytobacillus firmus]|uniref:restriction endonuclease subunit S n=1 Tax=Cytobacillus firmus TaxID=1399 RepID=UPI00384F1378
MINNCTPDIRFAGFTKDWEQRKLGELIDISSAARVHKNEWTTSGVRFFRSSDVVSNFNGKKNKPAFISYSLYDELSKKSGRLQPGDILVTGGGTIGIPYLISDQEPLYFKDADLIWLKSAKKIDGYFLYYFFVTPQLRKHISSITHIGTISHYTIEQSKDTPIKLPERSEQTQIGIFFKQLDDTIALYQQELNTLKQTKQGFLQKMFPKEGESVPEVRFPGFTRNWEDSKLDSIVDRLKSYSLSRDIETSEYTGYKYIHYGDIHTKVADVIDESSNLPNIKAGNYELLEKGDLVIADASEDYQGIATPAVITVDMPYKLVSGLHTIALRPKSKQVDSLFLYYLINSPIFRKYGYKAGTGMKVFGISVTNLLKFESMFPSLEEQLKIGKFLKHLDDTIALHQRELDALKETKKAFLQKMFA